MTQLTIHLEDDGDTLLLHMRGDLDYQGAASAEEAIASVDGAGGPRTLVLDLRELTFMDSTGLRIVLSADATQRERGGELVLVRGPEVVDRVFRLARLEERLRFVDDPKDLTP